MDPDSDKESMEGDVEPIDKAAANWGKAKFDYYYTDYVDKDYPSKLSAKEERLAALEQEEALRIQRKLLSTLEDEDLKPLYEIEDEESGEPNIIELIEQQNQALQAAIKTGTESSKKRKRVVFEDERVDSENEGDDDDDEDNDDDDDEEDNDEEGDADGYEMGKKPKEAEGRQRRPINVAIKKNRGLTPYKKKEYRNPRVKHKMKYKKAMSKRRRNVREAQPEYHRYSGETTGIKTSTIKSIKLC